MADVHRVLENRLSAAHVALPLPLRVEQPSPAKPLIMIVDDFEDVRELYREYLEFAGLRVITAESGAEAIPLALEREPNLILMDIRMPGMSGTKAMLELRRHPPLATTPIIALTAHAVESERLAILREGFDGLILKPCLPDELLRFVERTLHVQTAEQLS